MHIRFNCFFFKESDFLGPRGKNPISLKEIPGTFYLGAVLMDTAPQPHLEIHCLDCGWRAWGGSMLPDKSCSLEFAR